MGEGSQKTWNLGETLEAQKGESSRMNNCNSGDIFWDLSQRFELNREGIQHINLLRFETVHLPMIIKL